MVNFTELTFICDQCREDIHRLVRYWPDEGYTGGVLLSIWCPHCGNPQVVEYEFSVMTREAALVQHLTPSKVLVPREPSTGITVSPRKKSR